MKWREGFGAVCALGGVGAFVIGRLMGAHWNFWLIWLMFAVPIGFLARGIAMKKGWLKSQRDRMFWVHGVVRSFAVIMGLIAIETAVVDIQMADERTQVLLVDLALAGGALALAWIGAQWRSVAGTIALGIVGSIFAWDLLQPYLPEQGQPVPLDSPFDDIATVFHGGPTPLYNHHASLTSQFYALDMVLAPGGSEEVGDPATNEGWACFGAPLLAPADGVVVAAKDSETDLVPGAIGMGESLVGNHVSLQIAPDRYVILAHLQHNSVQVEVGQKVTTGTLLGRCGNTGNTTQPHLHIQVQNKPMVSNSDPEIQTFPIHWRKVRRGDKTLTNATGHRNDKVLPAG